MRTFSPLREKRMKMQSRFWNARHDNGMNLWHNDRAVKLFHAREAILEFYTSHEKEKVYSRGRTISFLFSAKGHYHVCLGDERSDRSFVLRIEINECASSDYVPPYIEIYIRSSGCSFSKESSRRAITLLICIHERIHYGAVNCR